MTCAGAGVKGRTPTGGRASVEPMRKYLFGTGLVSAAIGGLTLLRSTRDDAPFTWRTALAWLSWGITLALAIGSAVDTRRASTGRLIATDSPVHGDEAKLMQKRLRKRLR